MAKFKSSRRYRTAREQLPKGPAGSIVEAIERLQVLPQVKFDESVELACRLNIDTQEVKQPVRGTVSLPHGTGRVIRVVALCTGEQATAASEAGAESVGAKELIERIAGGWLDFDVVVAAPDMMREMSKLGKVLGPRGLMPSPKAGTVTTDMAATVHDIKTGKIEFKMDKLGNIHVMVGRRSFAADQLADNVKTVLSAILQQRPAAERSTFLRSATLSSTMSPGIALDAAAVAKVVR